MLRSHHGLIAVFALFGSSSGFALDAAIKTTAEGGATPIIVGVTNLPEETKLMISLRRAEAKYSAQSHATVRGGQFKSERFSAFGKPLPPGRYQLDVTMPLPAVQVPAVQTVIGQRGERLSGTLVEKSQFGITLRSHSIINIGGAASTAADEATKRDEQVHMEKWRRENCDWINKVTGSTRPVSECIERLKR